MWEDWTWPLISLRLIFQSQNVDHHSDVEVNVKVKWNNIGTSPQPIVGSQKILIYQESLKVCFDFHRELSLLLSQFFSFLWEAIHSLLASFPILPIHPLSFSLNSNAARSMILDFFLMASNEPFSSFTQLLPIPSRMPLPNPQPLVSVTLGSHIPL